MAQVFTRSVLQGLQCNLQTNIASAPRILIQEPQKSSELSSEFLYKDWYFQLLIFEDLESEPQLVYGKKTDLDKHYNLPGDPPKPNDPNHDYFPTNGVEIKQDFLKPAEPIIDPLAFIKEGTVRFLLITRKISQMIAYTWLEEENIPPELKDNVKLVRKIFKDYRKTPDAYWLENSSLTSVPDINAKLLEIHKPPQPQDHFLIKPDHISYNAISLALLLCGQAYYKKSDQQYSRIWQPIASIYEIIVQYGIEVSWEGFFATITELIQSGTEKPYPTFKVTIPYPPRPSEFALPQKEIQVWATAEDDGGSYPFYPQVETKEWTEPQVQNVYPPQSYIPACF